MKPSTAANLALGLAPVALLLLLYGVATGMGDPAPWVPKVETDVRLERASLAQLAGACLWGAAMALAAFGLRGARRRALAGLAVATIPLLAWLAL